MNITQGDHVSTEECETRLWEVNILTAKTDQYTEGRSQGVRPFAVARFLIWAFDTPCIICPYLASHSRCNCQLLSSP